MYKKHFTHTEGSEADQLLAFERLYLQVSACLSQRFNQNTKQLTADQNSQFEWSHTVAYVAFLLTLGSPDSAYVHKIKIKPPFSKSRLKKQIQIGSRFRSAFCLTFYYTMPKFAFASSCWQCQSAERQAAYVPDRSHRSTHKPTCQMCIIQPFQTALLHAALLSDQHGLNGATVSSCSAETTG